MRPTATIAIIRRCARWVARDSSTAVPITSSGRDAHGAGQARVPDHPLADRGSEQPDDEEPAGTPHREAAHAPRRDHRDRDRDRHGLGRAGEHRPIVLPHRAQAGQVADQPDHRNAHVQREREQREHARDREQPALDAARPRPRARDREHRDDPDVREPVRAARDRERRHDPPEIAERAGQGEAALAVLREARRAVHDHREVGQPHVRRQQDRHGRDDEMRRRDGQRRVAPSDWPAGQRGAVDDQHDRVDHDEQQQLRRHERREEERRPTRRARRRNEARRRAARTPRVRTAGSGTGDTDRRSRC